MSSIDLDLHYKIHPGSGPPLLLVHGFLSSSAQWAANIRGLTNFTTPITVDLWGHGNSPAPEDPAHYAVDAYIDAFERLRVRLGFQQWSLCGASFGAGLTLRYALNHPERIEGQVFTNSISGFSRAVDSREKRQKRASSVIAAGQQGLWDMPMHPRFAKRLDPAVAAALVSDAEKLSLEGIANAISVTVENLSVADSFHQTMVPTLLINGRRETAFQPIRDWAVNTLPRLQVCDLDGGHSINAEQPDLFDAAVRDFLQGQKR